MRRFLPKQFPNVLNSLSCLASLGSAIRDTTEVRQAAAGNSNLRRLRVPDLNLPTGSGGFRQTPGENIADLGGVGKGGSALPLPPFSTLLERC
jgi:hypothetical protein